MTNTVAPVDRKLAHRDLVRLDPTYRALHEARAYWLGQSQRDSSQATDDETVSAIRAFHRYRLTGVVL